MSAGQSSAAMLRWQSAEYRQRQVDAQRRRFEARDLVAWFLSKAEPEPNSGCLIWIGNTDKVTGYGMVRSQPEILAHRLSYRLFIGPVPPGAFVLHRCDFRVCVNAWSHLYLGDHVQNMRDMVARGRADDRRGSRGPSAKLTEAQIPEIRRLRAQGLLCREIGEMFGVSAGAIQQISSGRRWTHV